MAREESQMRLTARTTDAPTHTPAIGEAMRSGSSPGAAWWRGAVIAAAALALALGLLYLVWLLARPLALLFAAIAIAEGLSPIVDRVASRLPRPIAVILVYLVLVLMVAALGWFLIPRLVAQAQELIAALPELLDRLRSFANRWDPGGQGRIIDAAQGRITALSGPVVELPFLIANALLEIVLVLFMSIYWLIAKPDLDAFVRKLFPPRHRDKYERVTERLSGSIGGYVRGTVIDAIAVATLSFVGLTVIGIQYTVVLAILAGLGELIPVVGPILAAVPAVGVGLLDSTTKGLIVLGFYIVLQQIESNILVPLVMNSQAHVPPLLALFAVFSASTIDGILAVLVAVPLAAALKVLVIQVVVPAEKKWLSRGDRRAVDRPSPG